MKSNGLLPGKYRRRRRTGRRWWRRTWTLTIWYTAFRKKLHRKFNEHIIIIEMCSYRALTKIFNNIFAHALQTSHWLAHLLLDASHHNIIMRG